MCQPEFKKETQNILNYTESLYYTKFKNILSYPECVATLLH